MTVGSRIEHALSRRLDSAGPEAHGALLAAAVADDDALGPVLGAGATVEALESAEAAGLVSLSPGRVVFRHPLVRSVVLGRAEPADRRAAHRAYGGALGEGDRAVWHAAAGAVAPDEAIAGALAAAGERAAQRGGHAAAASALEHAARLSPDLARRAERLLQAAEATWLAGDGPGALALLGEADPVMPADARPAADHLRGRVLVRRGPVTAAIRVLRDAAEAIAPRDPALAAEMLADAAYAAVFTHPDEMLELARRAEALAPAEALRARSLATVALGAALVMAGDPSAADALEAADALMASTPGLAEDVVLAPWLGVTLVYRRADIEQYDRLARVVTLARNRGAVGILPVSLFYLGVGSFAAGRWPEAAARFSEAVQLAEEAGLRVDAAAALAGLARLEARRGEGGRVALALDRAREAGLPFFQAWALHAQGEAALGGGDAEGARSAFEAKRELLAEYGVNDADLSAAPELAETLVHLGEDATEAAREALAEAEAKGRPWALARAHRAAGLAAPGHEAALASFATALGLHEAARDGFEAARTRLCLGERLRRAGRRGRCARAAARGADGVRRPRRGAVGPPGGGGAGARRARSPAAATPPRSTSSRRRSSASPRCWRAERRRARPGRRCT